MHIHISSGNSKMGAIPSISFPQVSCRKDAPCRKDCYANKAFRQYPGVRKAWNENWKLWNQNPDAFFGELDLWLENEQPAFFRFFVCGDVPNVDFAYRALFLANEHRSVKFLTFTKKPEVWRDAVVQQHVVPNFEIVSSQWPGWKCRETNMFRKAYMQDGSVKVPKTALECPGNCESCAMCWHLTKLKKDVVFNKH